MTSLGNNEKESKITRRGPGKKLVTPPWTSSATETENTDEEFDTTEKEESRTSQTESTLKRRGDGSPSFRPSKPHTHVLPQLENEKPLSQRLDVLKVRVVFSIVIFFLFFLVVAAGHFYISMFVLAVTSHMYREIVAIKRNEQKDQKLALFFFLRWYWFILTIYGTGYSWLIPIADGLQLPRSRFLEIFVTHHLIITYSFALLGLVVFILSLRRFSLRYQFSQFAVMLLTCLFAVGQTLFQIANLSDGLIWFIMSTSPVIINDVFAYLFGIFLGRTRLIKLSPKKTVEGFVGASVVTLIWSVVVGSILSNFQPFICPQRDVIFRPFTVWSQLRCEPMPIFKLQEYRCPSWLHHIIGFDHILLRPAVFHFLVLGVFAAFFAPFGGFFASALKRASRIKDFGDSIPGHGGITDRLDCQILMAMFTFLYVRTFVRTRRPSIDYIISLASRLSGDERISLLSALQSLPSG